MRIEGSIGCMISTSKANSTVSVLFFFFTPMAYLKPWKTFEKPQTVLWVLQIALFGDF